MDFSATAQDLLQSAKDAKEKSKEAVKAGVKSSQVKVKEVADLVIDEAHKAAGNAKEFVKGAVHRAEEYAEHAKSSGSKMKGDFHENLSKAIEAQKSSNSGVSGILAWCTSFCESSKNTDPERELAEDVTQALKDATAKLQEETSAATSSSKSD